MSFAEESPFKEYSEDDYLQLSGIQHFAFCRRQWALIHIEGIWAENVRTITGGYLHERVHDASNDHMRSDVLISRGMPIHSRRLGISGACDVVEFHLTPGGFTLAGREGTYRAYPVEYKRGEPKQDDCDRLQLCAQAMCLEEMLLTEISDGALFYGETRRREKVPFDSALRSGVKSAFEEMHALFARGYSPIPKRTKACNACSLKDACLPSLGKARSVEDYINRRMTEEET